MKLNDSNFPGVGNLDKRWKFSFWSFQAWKSLWICLQVWEFSLEAMKHFRKYICYRSLALVTFMKMFSCNHKIMHVKLVVKIEFWAWEFC